jgi:hypothetical protein
VYVINPEALPKDDVFWCNGILGEWLIFEKHFPLFCRKGRHFGFAKTKELEDVLKELPLWLKCTKVF